MIVSEILMSVSVSLLCVSVACQRVFMSCVSSPVWQMLCRTLVELGPRDNQSNVTWPCAPRQLILAFIEG